METALICLSHLRWDHVWQRPHHLMSRLAQYLPVIFVEEPWIGEWPGVHEAWLEERPGLPRVRVIRPLVPEELLDTPDNSYRAIFSRLFDQILQQAGPQPIIWEYTPMMVYLAEQAGARLIVHDAMDELAQFRGAPADLRQREQQLMDISDIVFTGGRSLYEARKDRHPRVFCFPSGVDLDHYRQALDPNTTEPADVADLPHPRLGYFGVLDERLDWELIGAVAEARPQWQWIFVGPTAKIEPSDLPQLPNIRYLGQRSYNDLPAYLKSFDVATMPFAMNDATRYISPTKTLEYMAGHAPIVSTLVPDVVRSYGSLVRLADGLPAFIAAVEAALREAPAERQARIERELPVLAEHSWDGIADRMWQIMQERLAATQSNHDGS
ncbi:MAG: glycosyltransferase [Herpetosiphonaceae bacterium]|nr:glycosyltransferase [Herpetosiphonaceae bacterium]